MNLGVIAEWKVVGGELIEMVVAGTHWVVEDHPLFVVVVVGLGLVVRRLCRLVQFHEAGRQRERRMRQELEAYARMDASLPAGGDAKGLARRVCRTVREKSAFQRVAMLVRDVEGKLFVAGSAGMDDRAVASLQTWGQGVVREERGLGEGGPEQAQPRLKVGAEGFVVELAYGETMPAGCRRAVVTLLRTQTGGILGALAVCAGELAEGWQTTLEEAMPPIEALAIKLAQALENASLTERVMRVERLAGLGQLAGGVAHELNNPLTAVIGFAELIAETSNEARVREDASTIIREALHMKDTVQGLLNFWRPVTLRDEAIDLGELLGELLGACEPTLRERGVGLFLEVAEDLPELRGNRERLGQVVQHLLNNAAQAIANSKEQRRAGDRVTDPEKLGLPRGSDEGDLYPTIRVTVSHDARTLHLIVSDTGPGFPEPGRAFDPFYTTREPGKGSGLGLSVCYGIVREHGGEISAFNLHPHGAAVVVELPVGRTVSDETEVSVVVRDFPNEFGIQPTHDRRRKQVAAGVR